MKNHPKRVVLNEKDRREQYNERIKNRNRIHKAGSVS
jgi:hypothetical protein